MLIAQGTLIDNKYEVIGSIGVGGMGVVYEAYQRSLERVVAVKMLTASAGGDDGDRIRFEREALILSRLSNPNIVQFYAYGIWSKIPYIVIERVNGESLQRLLAKNEPMDVPMALDIARQVCDGLQHVHANGVLHRDLKPTNILTVDSPGHGVHVKLIDFGLAKLIGLNNFQKLTQTGMALGSVMYASPEQCLGQPLDARSDIYSLGCVLYEMLTGFPPYTADNVTAVMFQQLNESVGSTGNWLKVPAELQPVLSKCMAKEKERRYSSAAALKEDLERVLDGHVAELEGSAVAADDTFHSAKNPFRSPSGPEFNSARKHFVVGTLAFLAFCLIIAGGVLSLGRTEVAPPQPLARTLVHDQLYQLVNENKIGQLDEPKVKRILSLIESYKRDRYRYMDHTSLMMQAYQMANSYYYDKKDWGAVRQYCKQALEDCSDTTKDPNGNYYLNLVQAYHDACVPAHCQLSLIPLLENTLKRYPEGNRSHRFGLYRALATDYLELGRFQDARQAANQAASLTVKEKNKDVGKWVLLGAYHQVIISHSDKKDWAAVRRYCKHAVEDCGDKAADPAGDVYLNVVQAYHDACLPTHCNVSLVPLLQNTLKRYPNGNRGYRLGLYRSLAYDYVEQGRFDAARQAANSAAALAVKEEPNGGRWILMGAYHMVIRYYCSKKDWAAVRRCCKQALEDCSGVYAEHGEATVFLVQTYHEASEPVRSHLLLVPLLEDTFKRYPKANSEQRFELCLTLSADYLQLKRFDAARQAANQAASLASTDERKSRCESILQKCDEQEKHPVR